MSLRLPFLAVAVALAGAFSTSTSLRHVDAVRRGHDVDEALMFLPEPEQLRVASSGFGEPLADLFWVRAVLTFGERYDRETGALWTEWLRRMIGTVYTLDPTWRTAYFYGGSLLRVAGDIEGSDEVFAAGHRNLPNEPYFPFNLGMNAYLYRNDAATAGDLLKTASLIPGAPGWYAAAAAAMSAKSGARAAGIHFLEELASSTSDPAILEDTHRQLARLRHDDLVDGWTDVCKRFRDEHGRPLRDAAELASLGVAVPENPRGDAWVVGRDGVVRSEAAEAERYRRAARAEWPFLK